MTTRGKLLGLWMMGILLAVTPVFGAVQGAGADAETAADPLEFLLGRWAVEGSSVQADRSVVRVSGFLQVDRYEEGDRAGIQESWYLTAPFSVADGGRSLRVFDAASGLWHSRFDPAYPPLAWPPWTTLEPGSEKLVIPASAHGDGTGDHHQRAAYSEISASGWSWTLERSYDGGATWFAIQRVTARRVGDAYATIRARHPAPLGGEVTTLLTGFDGSRGLAVDPEGNLYIAARLEGEETVPVLRLRPDGRREVVATGLEPVGLVWAGGALYVYDAGPEPGRVVRIEADGAVDVVAQVAGAAIAVDPAGTVYTIAPQGTESVATDAEGDSKVLASSAELAGVFSLVYDPARELLYGAKFGSGEILAVAGDGAVRRLAAVPGFGGGNAAWLALAEDRLYVTGFGTERVFSVDPATGRVRPVAGSGLPGQRDGPAAVATFRSPNGIAVSPDRRTLYVADLGDMGGGVYPANRLRRIRLPAP